MRNTLCSGLVAHAASEKFVFLTGDLGYDALEPLREVMGERFINAGIAEQNMIAVAAGLAKSGLEPWCYSIAPFLYARPYEQIRNDLCLHNLPVRLVANGGGYGYGVMGSTHHAIEDYGALLCLQHMQVYVPAFSEDVLAQIEKAPSIDAPLYFRLGRSEKPKGYEGPSYAPWRKLVDGDGAVALFVGPLVGPVLARALDCPKHIRPTIWLVTELPILVDQIPAEFLRDIERSGDLLVAEEHVRQGSAGLSVAGHLLDLGVVPRKFRLRCAQGYPSGRYGSQGFHRRESGIDAETLYVELMSHG